MLQSLSERLRICDMKLLLLLLVVAVPHSAVKVASWLLVLMGLFDPPLAGSLHEGLVTRKDASASPSGAFDIDKDGRIPGYSGGDSRALPPPSMR